MMRRYHRLPRVFALMAVSIGAAALATGSSSIAKSLPHTAGRQRPAADVRAQASRPNTWSTVAPLPEGLLWPAVASAAGKLYVFGGLGPKSFLTTFEAYDPKTNHWTSMGNMPAALGSLPSATTGPDGLIYIYAQPQGAASTVMLVYDPRANTWRHAPPPTRIPDSALLVTGRDGRIYAVFGMSGMLSVYDTHKHTWTRLAPAPTPLYQPAATVGPDGRVYVIGTDQMGAMVKFQAYDPRRNAWTSVASLPTSRFALQAVTGPDGRIYALGGEGRCSTAPCHEVEAYDVHTARWTAVAPMPRGRWNFAAVVGPDGRIYVLGGFTTPDEVMPGSLPKEVDAYTVVPANQPLPTPAPGPVIATRVLAAMPTAREGLGAATSGGKIYAIGGQAVVPPKVVVRPKPGASTPPPRILRTVEAYDPTTNTWSAEPPLPAPRVDMGVTTGLDGRIYVLGGLATSPNETETKGARGLSTVFIYDPRTQRWSQGTPMPEGSYGLAAVTGKDGRIYAIGGASYCYDSCNTIQAVRAFTPQTNTWTTLAPLPAWRILPAAAVGTDGRIYVFGGDSLPRGWFEVYDPGKNRWTKVTGLPHVRSGGFAASAAQDGHIYLVGGCLVTHVTQSGYNNYCGDPSPVDAYDPRTNAWTSVGVTMNQRQALAAATGPDGLVYAVGGQGYGNGKLLEVIRPALRGH